jgi:hypothetical protein
MKELFRFLQLRQSQKLSEEQKRFIGLPLYPDDDYSPLARRLIEIIKGNTASDSLAEILEEHSRTEKPIEDPANLQPAIRALYDWLNFKAQPLKTTEFSDFILSLNPFEEFDLKKEWITYADSLLIAIYQRSISINYCVDFQLLIRICYLFKLCILVKDGHMQVKDGTSAALLDVILTKPILLPPLVLRGRCPTDCRTRGKVELPKTLTPSEMRTKNPCECKCDESCQKPSGHCVCINTYVAELFIIKEELARYEEGDIANIENILAGEKKLRLHRALYRTEEISETEKETISSEERDHQVSEKFSLQEEVKTTIDSEVGVDAGVTATLKYGKAVTVTPHANVTAKFSKSKAENLAHSYAKEIVDRSATKVQEKVRKLQVSKILNEIEEKSKHSINNTQADADHRAGIYYWVNKITHAQVFNYGKHLMFDVIVPEPAAMFKKLYELKNKKDNKRIFPQRPTLTLDSITRNTYLQILNDHGLSEAIEPPDERTAIQFAFHQNLTEPEDHVTTGFSSAEFKSEQIPDGYKAESFDYSINCFVGDPAAQTGPDEASVSVNVGNTSLLAKVAPAQGLQHINNWSTGNSNVPMNDETGVITASVAGYSSVALSLSGTISIKCKLTDEAFDKWRVQIYNLVMDDYTKKLDAFESNKKEDPLIQIKGRNPFLNREIERNELKRHIIALLICNYFNGIGSMMERVAPCGYPEIDFAKLEKDAPIIQFFEQVIEWNYCNYLFYHSMWARKCKWPELIDEDSGDPLFDKFLMAGAARVQVPIRSGMEDFFAWFLKTGQIWGASGIPPVSGDDEYVSMIQELKESKQCDYTDRPGLVESTNGNEVLKLTDSTFYWDLVNDQLNTLALTNDKDRELLLNYEVYRIVKVEQATAGDPTAWLITIDRPYEGVSAQNLKHAVGALYAGAPWEVVIPTKLVYLRNTTDKLPTYPLA